MQKEPGLAVTITRLIAESGNFFSRSFSKNHHSFCVAALFEFPKGTACLGICRSDTHSLFSTIPILLQVPEKIWGKTLNSAAAMWSGFVFYLIRDLLVEPSCLANDGRTYKLDGNILSFPKFQILPCGKHVFQIPDACSGCAVIEPHLSREGGSQRENTCGDEAWWFVFTWGLQFPCWGQTQL